MEAVLQAIALIADSSHELDLRRRNLFTTGLKQEFKSVCSDNAPVTNLLFGEELSQQIKDIKETNKITYKPQNFVVPLNPTYNSRRSRKIFPFLGRGHTPYRQRPGNPGNSVNQSHRNKPPQKYRGNTKKTPVIEVRNHTYFKNEISNLDHSDLTLSATKVQFIAGNVKNQYFNWLKITSDKTILNMVKGCIIDFESPPTQTYQPDCKFSVENGIVRGERFKLLDKQVIVPSTHERDEFVSPIWISPHDTSKE